MISFQLIYLFKDHIAKYSHILKDWGLGLQHTHLGEDATWHIT